MNYYNDTLCVACLTREKISVLTNNIEVCYVLNQTVYHFV